MKKLVFIQDISLKDSPKVRISVRQDVVEEYAEAMLDKVVLPPVHLFLSRTTKQYLVADGWHRIEAAKLNKQRGITAEVQDGEYEDALLAALVSNTRHGLRRTVADKAAAIRSALKQWPGKSNTQIAKCCMVNDHMIGDVRKEMEKEKVIPVTTTRVASDGSVRSAKRVSKVTETPEELTESADLPRKMRGSTTDNTLEIKDTMGYAIPEKVICNWVRAEEVKQMLKQLKDIRLYLRDADKDCDVVYGEVNIGGAMADLEKVESALGMAVPYAVCTSCQGHPETQPKGQCRMCKGKGLISQFLWKLVPEEIRELRKKQIK